MMLSFISACEKSEDIYPYDIVGSWKGTRTYNNPVGGIKYQYLYLDFYDDGTGKMEYESPVSYSIAYFEYSVSSNIVRCKGAYADTYGDVASDFQMTLTLEGDRLIPNDRFPDFILTKDGSVITDGNGEEIKDPSDEESEDKVNDELSKVVKDNVKISAYYSNYYAHIKIEHTLTSIFSGKKVGYKFAHSDKSDANEAFVIDSSDKPIAPTIKTDGNKVTVTIDYPFYYYYVCKALDTTSYGEKQDYFEIVTSSEMNLASLKFLNEKDNLYQSEEELKESLIEILYKYELVTLGDYTIWMYITLDDKSILIGKYTILYS